MKKNANQYSFASHEERFNSKFIVAPDSGCWLWMSPVSKDGYGQFSVGKKSHKAHRFSYERYIGGIPEGLQLDHLCKTTICVNPRHLEVVTAKENISRSDSYNRNKTHCRHGHEFTESNTYTSPKSFRGCRICIKTRAKRFKERRVETTRAA